MTKLILDVVLTVRRYFKTTGIKFNLDVILVNDDSILVYKNKQKCIESKFLFERLKESFTNLPFLLHNIVLMSVISNKETIFRINTFCCVTFCK